MVLLAHFQRRSSEVWPQQAEKEHQGPAGPPSGEQ